MRNGQNVLSGFLLFTAVFSAIFLFFFGTQAPIHLPSTPDSSFLGRKEAVPAVTESRHQREHFEAAMLRNPASGLIPANIRARELAYSKTLPVVGPKSRRYLRTGGADWRRVGPANVGGRTRAVGIDVRDESVILAGGVSGGMWRTTNGGATWSRVSELNNVQSVTTLAQDPRSGSQDVWYYGTGEIRGNTASGGQAPYRGNGVFKSTNNGRTWTPLTATQSNTPEALDNPFDYVNRIVVDPTSLLPSGAVYVAALGGIYRTLDGGQTFSFALGDGLSSNAALYTDIAVTSEGNFYAAIGKEGLQGNAAGAGIFFSTDGMVWQNITPLSLPSSYERIVLAISPSNEDIVYALAHTSNGNSFLGRYNRATGQWSNRSQNIPAFGGRVGDFDTQENFNMVVAVHPQDEDIVFLGGTNLYRSRDGFSTSSQTAWIGGYATTNDASLYPNHHPDQHLVLFYSSQPNKMLSAHDGGLSVTANSLADEVLWEELNNGYVTTQFYTVSQDEVAINDRITGGLQDNGSYTTFEDDPSTPWSRILSGDGGFTAVAQNGSFYYFSFQNSQIYRINLNSEGSITNFARIDPIGGGAEEGQEYLFINPFTLDPNNQNRMYLAGGDMIWRNNSLLQIPGGSQSPTSVNWERLLDTDLPNGQITAIKVSREPANFVYYGTNTGRVFVITNAQSSDYTVREITSPLFPQNNIGDPAGYVASIAINPLNASEILVAFSNYGINSIFHSTNVGDTFVPVSGNLEENPDGTGSGPSVRWVEIVPLEDGNLYMAGTSTGLYSAGTLQAASTTWEQEGPDLIGANVVPMLSYRSTDGRVVAASHGNGVFVAELDNAVPFAMVDEGDKVKLEGNYPNPWVVSPSNPYTYIPLYLPTEGLGRIRIYDSEGRLVRNLLEGGFAEGRQTLLWDGTNTAGADVAPGTYICRLEFEREIYISRIVLLR